MKKMKKILSILIILSLFSNIFSVNLIKAEKKSENNEKSVELSAASAILIEGSTGKIIYEKNKDEELPLASITKIMTLLLTFEALENGKIKLTDDVSVSEHAASMGGSQVFLEVGETQTVDNMIKCIAVSSANDASVAMAEYISGSEEEFVAKMNEKAKSIGMKNTNFVNCCGLDVDNHYSTANDVSLMARELIMKYPQISDYSTIWMDTIKHVTKKGESEFGLSNTNKLVKTYDGITGLKTGSTSKAKYCLCATAKRQGMNLIAVIMKAPDYKVRFPEAAKLLNYGFANCSLYIDNNKDVKIDNIPIKKGIKDNVLPEIADNFSYICMKEITKKDIHKKIVIVENLEAPITVGSKIGEIKYFINDKEIGFIPITAKEEIKVAKYNDFLIKTINIFFDLQKE